MGRLGLGFGGCGREAGDEGREVGRNLGVLTVDRAGGEKRQAEHQLCLGRQS